MNLPPIVCCPQCNGAAVSTAHVLAHYHGAPTRVLVLAHCKRCDRSWVKR